MILPLVEGGVGVWPLLFVLGFCCIGWNGVWIATAAESVSPTSVGRATSTVLIFAFAGGIVLPPVFGELVDGTGSWLVTWSIGAAAVAGLVLFLRLSSRRAAVPT